MYISWKNFGWGCVCVLACMHASVCVCMLMCSHMCAFIRTIRLASQTTNIHSENWNSLCVIAIRLTNTNRGHKQITLNMLFNSIVETLQLSMAVPTQTKFYSNHGKIMNERAAKSISWQCFLILTVLIVPNSQMSKKIDGYIPVHSN